MNAKHQLTTQQPALELQRKQDAPRTVFYLRARAETRKTEEQLLREQRRACLRKAKSLGYNSVAEFADRGEGALNLQRPGLRRLMAYVHDQPVDYVIVQSLDRLMRNVSTGLEINSALARSGVTVVSASENIDNSSRSRLMQAISESMAGLYSDSLSERVKTGRVQSAMRGETPFRLPLGYRPEYTIVKGRLVRSVQLDHQAALAIKSAFRRYARGTHSLAEVRDAMVRECSGGRMAFTRLKSILRNPYYVGIVRISGNDYPGKHRALVDRATFDEVQRRIAEGDSPGSPRSLKRAQHPRVTAERRNT